jgi:hypothetical protein
MINFPNTTGVPTAPEHNDARARRERGRDFAGWLEQCPEGGSPADAKARPQAGAMPASVPHAAAPIADAAPAAPGPSRARDLETLIAMTEPPHPILPGMGLPLRGDAMPGHADVAAVAQRVLDVLAAVVPQHVDALHLPPSGEGHGHRELADDVLLPWRLQANAGLSYLSAPGLDARVADPATKPSPLDGFGSPGGAGASTPLAAPEPAGDSAAALRRGALAWTTYLADHSFGGVDREQRMQRLQQWLAEHTDWPERLLRWFGHDADVTAWVRDFQLGETDLPALVRKLREYAQEHGRPLARVMHNGREVWSAHNDNTTNGSES